MKALARKLGLGNWHREAIGGMWDKIGPLQLEVLKTQGLKPHHSLLDIGCGSLRGGVHFIGYLDPGRYVGIEKEPSLIKAAITKEIPGHNLQAKRPAIHHIENLNIDAITEPAAFDYMLAWSVWTHMTPELIETCVRNIAPRLSPEGRFYATFFEAEETKIGAKHAWRRNEIGMAAYPFSLLSEIAARCGFTAHYIGDINHPRQQRLLYLARR